MKNQIECLNYQENDQVLKDYFTEKEFKTSNNVIFAFNGHPVSPERAYHQGFSFAKDFKFPEFKSKVEVSAYLRGLKIPVGDSYTQAYGELSQGLPTGKAIYVKPEHS